MSLCSWDSSKSCWVQTSLCSPSTELTLQQSSSLPHETPQVGRDLQRSPHPASCSEQVVEEWLLRCCGSHSGGPHWTRFSASVSFLGWGAQSWMQWSSPTNLKEGTKDFPPAAAYPLADRPQGTVGLFCWKDVVLPHIHHTAHQIPQVLFCSTAFWPANPHLYLEQPPHSRMPAASGAQLTAPASRFAAVTKASGSPGEGLPAPSLEATCAVGFLH